MDICLCNKTDCEKSNVCLRSLLYSKVQTGNIITCSDFKECNKESNYENIRIAKKYKVETKISKGNSFSKTCLEHELYDTKVLVKQCSEGAKCYYREYPLNKSNKIYF